MYVGHVGLARSDVAAAEKLPIARIVEATQAARQRDRPHDQRVDALPPSATSVGQLQLARIFGVCAVVIALSTLFDMAFPQLMYSWSTPGVTPGRAAGFFINANKASEAVILTALLAMPALRTATALPLAVLAGVAVLVTFSRTGMVAWVVLIGLYWTGGLLRRGHLLAMAALAVLLVASGSLLALLVESQDLPTIAAADITDRLRFLGTGDLSDDSAQSRGAVVREGIDLFLRNPLVGAGSGATHVWDFGLAPHNFAVLMAAEYGVVGIAFWLALIALVATGGYFARRDHQWVAAGLLLMFSMATHNILDFPYWIVWILLLAMDFGMSAPRFSPRTQTPGAAVPVPDRSASAGR